MRHRRRCARFGRTTAHRLAMLDNMVTSLFLHERLLTTLEKAKELRRLAERLITLGKRGDLAARRLAAERLRTTGKREGARKVNREEALGKLFATLAPRYAKRPGGYTRIVRTAPRRGDGASMAYIELLPEEKKAEPKATGKRKAKAAAAQE